ncbi:hypothetical protein KEM60_02825 [Austwickia sp. TVS 96-490-7B]|uniref:phage holin family protein n=1 Tax=Austwickia sp. TVS 96-490-7B TaxID=2830843 RepID=UPI001C58B170|nr:phage holin family protein [Austwickia sp. TVS 96-490-7B]MBW3086597.1 hypothetical protein [Austwickia sp. TVS 96-490-7B]
MKTIVHTLCVAMATAVAAWLLPGIHISGAGTGSKIVTLIVVAVIIGVVNAIVRPIAKFLGGCLIVLSLGLFLLVINAAMLLLSSWIATNMGVGFRVDGFVTALIGSIVISVVSGILSSVLTPRS